MPDGKLRDGGIKFLKKVRSRVSSYCINCVGIYFIMVFL